MIDPLTPSPPANSGNGMRTTDFYDPARAAAWTTKYITEQQTQFAIEPYPHGIRCMLHNDGAGTVMITLDTSPDDRSPVLPNVTTEVSALGRCVLEGTLVEVINGELSTGPDFWQKWLYAVGPQNDDNVHIYVTDALVVGDNYLADKPLADRRTTLATLMSTAQAPHLTLLKTSTVNTVEDVARLLQEYATEPGAWAAWAKATNAPYPGQGGTESIDWVQYRTFFSFGAEVTGVEDADFAIVVADAPQTRPVGTVPTGGFQAIEDQVILVTAKRVTLNTTTGDLQLQDPAVIGLLTTPQPDDKDEIIRAAKRCDIYAEFAPTKSADTVAPPLPVTVGMTGPFVVQWHELGLDETMLQEDYPEKAQLYAVFRFAPRGEQKSVGFILPVDTWANRSTLENYTGKALPVAELLTGEATSWLGAGKRTPQTRRPRQAGATPTAHGRIRWLDSGKALVSAVDDNSIEFILEGGLLKGVWTLRKVTAPVPGPDMWEFKRLRAEPQLKSFFGTVQTTKGPRWLAISSAAFRDREKELVSTTAFDKAIEKSTRQRNRGELRIEHYENSRVGLCDEQFRLGKFLVESGTWDETTRGAKVKSFVDADSDGKVGVSIKFRAYGDIQDGVFDDIEIIERSITMSPINPWTSIRNVEGDMDEKSTRAKGLRLIVGDDEATDILVAERLAEKSTAETNIFIKGLDGGGAPTDPEEDPLWQPLVELVSMLEDLAMKTKFREAITNIRMQLATDDTEETTVEQQPVATGAVNVTTTTPKPTAPADLLKAEAERTQLHDAAMRRSERYGIAVRDDGALTIPAGDESLGAKEGDYGDPVNYKYPVWLTRDTVTEEQLGMVRNAPARFAQFKDNYDPRSRGVVEERITQALRKFRVGEYAEKKGEHMPDNLPASITEGTNAASETTAPVVETKATLPPETSLTVELDTALIEEVAKKAAEQAVPAVMASMTEVLAEIRKSIEGLAQAMVGLQAEVAKSGAEKAEETLRKMPRVTVMRASESRTADPDLVPPEPVKAATPAPNPFNKAPWRSMLQSQVLP